LLFGRTSATARHAGLAHASLSVAVDDLYFVAMDPDVSEQDPEYFRATEEGPKPDARADEGGDSNSRFR
jgi:hypothetical protein